MPESFHVKSAGHFIAAEHSQAPAIDKLVPQSLVRGDLPPSTGKGVKVCVVGSGLPEHRAIRNVHSGANLGPSEHSGDADGHAHAVAGLIGVSDGTGVMGLAPDCQLNFAKVTDDRGGADPASIAAAILWAISLGCSVVVVSHAPTAASDVLSLAVEKAYASDVAVVFDGTVAGVVVPEGGVSSDRLVAPEGRLVTTFRDGGYCEVAASDFTPALLGGVAALVAETHRPTSRSKPGSLPRKVKKIVG
jgi:hypothetical protein